ncbi:MAG: hypothetical protein ACLQIB_49765 [Isosphaeraceae bacterium]
MTSPSVNNSGGVSATFVYDADGELVDTTDADGLLAGAQNQPPRGA